MGTPQQTGVGVALGTVAMHTLPADYECESLKVPLNSPFLYRSCAFLQLPEMMFLRVCLELCLRRGAWVAQWVKRLTLDFDSVHDLTLCEFEPHIRLCASGMEPA